MLYTIYPSRSTISGLKALDFKNPLIILPKIMSKVASLVFLTLNMLKCLVNLCVKTLLPPPGGAATPITT